MESYNPDPIASASKGIAQAVIGEGKDQIKGWARKFLNGELAFIGEEKTISLAKEQRKSSEWNILDKYIEDKDLRILFNMGLTLRKLEKDDTPALIKLQKRIIKKYETNGLRVAHFVQNGSLNKYLMILLETAHSSDKITCEIEILLKDIDKSVAFVKSEHSQIISEKVASILAKIRANSPKIFVISSSWSAMAICSKIAKEVVKDLKGENYSVQLFQERRGRKIFFFVRNEEEV